MSYNDDSMADYYSEEEALEDFMAECACNGETDIEVRLQTFEGDVQWLIDFFRRLSDKRGRMEDYIILQE